MNYQIYHHQIICRGMAALVMMILLTFTSCQKEFLDKKPDRSRLVLNSLADYRAVLDYNGFFSAPALMEMSADDFYASDDAVTPLSQIEISAYTWAPDMFTGQSVVTDWNTPYRHVYLSNVVLDGLAELNSAEQAPKEYSYLRGTALFQRAFAYFTLSQIFIPPYDPRTAGNQAGLALRLVADVNAHPPRSTVQQTYDQILKDLQESYLLLPDQVEYKHRPCKAAALALLARVYLSMGDYANAGSNADKALQIRSELLNYADIKWNANDRLFPSALPNGNAEVIFYKGSIIYQIPTASGLAGVVPALYNSYASDDLRKSMFFRDRLNGFFSIRNTYGGTVNPALFTGLATDELYLIRAECEARAGRLTNALADINKLLLNRWTRGKYVDYASNDQEAVLRMILQERRKELVGRCLRWTDLRRLNLDSRFKVDLSRSYKGRTFTLPANDNRYTYPIPDYEVQAGMQPNP